MNIYFRFLNFIRGHTSIVSKYPQVLSLSTEIKVQQNLVFLGGTYIVIKVEIYSIEFKKKDIFKSVIHLSPKSYFKN